MADPPPLPVLDDLLSSSGKADLLVLFHRNPGLIDSVEGIARRIGKKGNEVASDLSQLQAASILEKKKIGKTEVYFLNREGDRTAKKDVAEYITGLGGKSK